jgi:SAM-dependent methyltransferase
MKRCLACGRHFTGNQWTCPSCAWQPAMANGVVSLAPELAPCAEGFDPAFFERLVSLESRSFWFRGRNRLVVWALRSYAGDAKRFLELGCGTGFVLRAIREAFPEMNITATEVLAEGLSKAAARTPDATFLQMDARRIPFVGEFDVIGAFDVLEHVDEDELVLAQIHTALVEGGILLLTVPQHAFLWSAADDYAHHQRRYSRAELLSKLRASGFTIVRWTSFVTLLMPLLLASRFAHRDTVHFDPEAEFRMPRSTNAILGGVMALERLAIRCGARLPFGGSLLVVARRPRGNSEPASD